MILVYFFHFKTRPPFGYSANSADPFQTLQNAASDQGQHCLFAEFSILNKITTKIDTRNRYNASKC